MRPIVLSVAGSDPSAGAGIQADLKAIEACGGRAATVVAAVTAQNSAGVRSVWPLPAEVVSAQLDAIFDDLPVAAVKSGMLGSAENVGALVDALQRHGDLPLVVDPVAISSSGHPLNRGATLDALVDRLAPLARVFTPNVDDARLLTGLEVHDEASAERAGRRLLSLGCSAVLVKGGHFGETEAVDLLVTADEVRRFAAPRIATDDTHGTGCLYASAIAVGLAAGLALHEAVGRAKECITRWIRHTVRSGQGRGAPDPLHALRTGEIPAKGLV